jgi:Zn-dependent metalloprotease
VCLFFSSLVYSQDNLANQQNVIRYDEKTKLPIAIYNVNARQYSGTPNEIARQYLIENRTLLGLKDSVDDIDATEVKESPAGFHVGFMQNYMGISVMRSETVVSINRQNRISMIVNGYKPNISINITPSISKDQALSLAKQAVSAADSKEIFPSKIELNVYEDSNSVFHLAWKALVYPPSGGRLVLVDGHDGNILENLSTSVGYSNGTGRVFDPEPTTYF